jgi:hypothetical protein
VTHRALCRRPWSVWTTGRGSAARATEQSSAISKDARQSRCCRIANRRRRSSGSRISRRTRLSRAIGAATINPDLLTAAERIQYEGYLRREETNAVIVGMAKNDIPIKAIVRHTGHSVALSERCCGVSARTCSGSGRAHSSFIYNVSTNNGQPDIVTARSRGGASRNRGSAASAGCLGVGGAAPADGKGGRGAEPNAIGRDELSNADTISKNGADFCG